MSETQIARSEMRLTDPKAEGTDKSTFRLTVDSIGLIYKTTHPVRRSFSKDFIAFLSEALQQEWDCHTCREWYREFGGDVAVSYEGGERKIVSAYFEPHQCPLPELADAFANLARKAVEGKLDSLRNTFDGPQFFGVVVAGEVSASVFGRKCAGGFDHFHAFFPVGVNLPRIGQGTIRHRVELLATTVGTYARIGKYNVIEGRIKQAISLLDYDGRASDALVRAAKTAAALSTLLRRVIVEAQPVEYAYMTMEYGDQERLHHLNGSTTGKFLEEIVLKESDHQRAISNFVKQTDPELYQRAEREADDKAMAEFAKVVDQFPGCLEYRLIAPHEVQHLTPIRTKSTEQVRVPEPEGRSATALLRSRVKAHEVAKEKPIQRLSVNHARPAEITIDSFIRTVLPNAERVEISTEGNARFSFAFEVDPDHLSESSPLKWGTRYSLSTLVNPAMWDHVGLGGSAGIDRWVPLLGLAHSPWYGLDTDNKDIIWWVIEGNAERSVGNFLGSLKPPLFSPYYRGEFFPHRRAMETLMADAAVTSVEKPAILIPAVAQINVRVYTDSNVLAYYKITPNDQDAVDVALEGYKALGIEA